MPVQIGCSGSGQQFGKVVLHYTTIDAGDDNSYWIFVEELEGSSLIFFMPLPLRNPVVDVSGLRQRSVDRFPATGTGIFPTQTPGEPICLIITYLVYEHTQAGLRRVVAHGDADQDGKNDDTDGRTHDSPAQRDHSPSTTNL